MSDYDTVPAPEDLEGRLAHQLAEVELACANVYQALEKVALTVRQIKLATLTVEHRQNAQREKLVSGGRILLDHERRLRALEGLTDTAAE